MNEYVSVRGVARSHSDNGNLKDDGKHTFVYDYKNRLIGAFDKATNNPVAAYLYYCDNRRAKKIVYSQTSPGVIERQERFFYDGQQVVEETDDAGNTLLTWVYSPVYVDEPVQYVRSSSHSLGAGTFYPHQNARADVVAVTDGAGAVAERRLYDDYGRSFDGTSKAPVSGSAVGNVYGFQGRRLDAETGLYYFRARYYDPSTGRFVQRDPVWDPGNFGNQYSFVGNGPVSGRDPMGDQRELADKEANATFVTHWAKSHFGEVSDSRGRKTARLDSRQQLHFKMRIAAAHLILAQQTADTLVHLGGLGASGLAALRAYRLQKAAQAVCEVGKLSKLNVVGKKPPVTDVDTAIVKAWERGGGLARLKSARSGIGSSQVLGGSKGGRDVKGKFTTGWSPMSKRADGTWTSASKAFESAAMERARFNYERFGTQVHIKPPSRGKFIPDGLGETAGRFTMLDAKSGNAKQTAKQLFGVPQAQAKGFEVRSKNAPWPQGSQVGPGAEYVEVTPSNVLKVLPRGR